MWLKLLTKFPPKESSWDSKDIRQKNEIKMAAKLYSLLHQRFRRLSTGLATSLNSVSAYFPFWASQKLQSKKAELYRDTIKVFASKWKRLPKYWNWSRHLLQLGLVIVSLQTWTMLVFPGNILKVVWRIAPVMMSRRNILEHIHYLRCRSIIHICSKSHKPLTARKICSKSLKVWARRNVRHLWRRLQNKL